MSEGMPATDATQAAPAAATLTRADLERDNPRLLDELRAYYIAIGIAAERCRAANRRSQIRRERKRKSRIAQQIQNHPAS